MSGFDFKAFSRIPEIDLTRLPFRATLKNFRHYTFRGDFSDSSHQQALTEFAQILIKEDRRAQRASRDFLLKAGVTPHVQKFQKRRGEVGGFLPDYADLFYLYAYIRAERPRRVLEYGSGVSTLVMALALEQNGEGRLVSLEASEEWAHSTHSALPERLFERVQVVYSRPGSREVDGESSVCFADQPFADPDMIYIDGAPEGARYDGAENVVLLEENFGEEGVTIFIDGRWKAVKFFNSPGRAARYEAMSCAVDVVDLRSGTLFGSPFGFDQFSNTMVRWRGTSPERHDMSADG